MTYAEIAVVLARENLAIFGGLHAEAGDNLPPEHQTLLLLGPAEPGFWAKFTSSLEYQDGAPDPLDRWSARVIGTFAHELGATALFPFGGPPHHPFMHWARRSGRAWTSPVHLLAHDRAGLMVSYRGALAFGERIALPPAPEAPKCTACAHACLTACPAGALNAEGYDIARCHRYLDAHPGGDCLTRGCAVRRSCPVSQSYGRLDAQSAFHMASFHP